jgi:hypothetical protein
VTTGENQPTGEDQPGQDQPTERQVLYALVGAGFHIVVAVLIIGAALVGLVPQWWTILMAITWVAVAVAVGTRWRKTARLLLATIGLFTIWTIGTLIVA